MAGMLGRILHEFAVTITVSILISGAVSLTLTPMLCSRFLKPQTEKRHGRLYNSMERFFDGMRNLYEKTLKLVLGRRRAVMVITVVMAVLTVWLFTKMPTGLLPSDDIGAIFAITEGAQGISFEDMKRHQQKLAEIVLEDPNVEAFMSSAGASGTRVGSNSGFMFIKLKPKHERKLNADQIIQSLRPKVMVVPGVLMFMQNPPPIRLEATLSKAQYQFVLQSPDTDELYKHASDFEMKVRGLTMIQDVTSDLQIKNPQVNLEIDRDRAAAFGVTAHQIEDSCTLHMAQGRSQQYILLQTSIK